MRSATGEADRMLAAQGAEQDALAARLTQMADQIAAALKEALRNKSIPTDLLEEWARHASAMQSLAERELAGASQLLGFASRNPGEAAERLGEALALEAEVQRKLLELQKQIGPALDRMLANTLANRLRRVAKSEARIRAGIGALLPETIGLAAQNLAQEWIQTLNGLALDQDMSRTEAQELEREIHRFFDRTSEALYGTVGREMKEERAVEGLGRIAGLIRENVGAMALKQSGHWEQRFDAWASLLEKAAEGMSSGGDGAGGEMSEAAMKRLLALLRLRQWEMNIRDHTRLLESSRSAYRGYWEDVMVLSIRQLYLKDDTKAVERMGASKFLPEVRKAMGEAETFLAQPRTDEPAVAAETDAVNLLEAEIQDMLRNVQGSSLAAAMGRMMRQMGMGLGTSGGGSMAGGAAGETFPALEGEVRGAVGGERAVAKAVGISTRPVPVEFREAIQDYHRAWEQIEAEAREETP
jgi:hypothetical protein